jgi:predicted nucleic acid-binding protein
MRAIFADTGYWVAIIYPRDGLHNRAMAVSRELEQQGSIVTSDMVLTEVLNMFSGRGSQLREAAASAVQQIVSDPSVEVIPRNCSR